MTETARIGCILVVGFKATFLAKIYFLHEPKEVQVKPQKNFSFLHRSRSWRNENSPRVAFHRRIMHLSVSPDNRNAEKGRKCHNVKLKSHSPTPATPGCHWMAQHVHKFSPDFPFLFSSSSRPKKDTLGGGMGSIACFNYNDPPTHSHKQQPTNGFR